MADEAADSSKIKVITSRVIPDVNAAKYLTKFIDNEEDFLERHKDFPQDVFEHLKVLCEELKKSDNHTRDVES